ncbi:hypothetical protein ACB092_08G110700 [Castanea dentata]
MLFYSMIYLLRQIALTLLIGFVQVLLLISIPDMKTCLKASSFSLNRVCICCLAKDIIFSAVGDKCRTYHLKPKSIIQRQHSLPAFIDR